VTVTNSAALGFASPEDAYNAFSSSLTNAVSNGQYTASLASAAAKNGATAFTQSTITTSPVIGPLVYQPGQPTPSPVSSPRNSSSKISGGIIAAIVIIIALFASVFSWCVLRKNLLISGLPAGYSDNELILAFHGVSTVRRNFQNPSSVVLVFQSRENAEASSMY
jgi:hypothetical protein